MAIDVDLNEPLHVPISASEGRAAPDSASMTPVELGHSLARISNSELSSPTGLRR
jgi:hypothetical protein